MKNFFTLLKDEHKEAKTLFAKLVEQDKVDREEASLLCNKLLLHMEMEEKYFYPVMEESKATQENAEEAELEHQEAKRLIKELLSNKPDDMAYKVKLEMLQLAIEHHVEEEEGEFFPKAKKQLSEDQIHEITEQMLELKEKKMASMAV